MRGVGWTQTMRDRGRTRTMRGGSTGGFVAAGLLLSCLVIFPPPSAARDEPGSFPGASTVRGRHSQMLPRREVYPGLGGMATAGRNRTPPVSGWVGEGSFLGRSLVDLFRPQEREGSTSSATSQQAQAGAGAGAGTGERAQAGAAPSTLAPTAGTQGLVFAPDAAALLKARASWVRAPGTVDKNHYLDTWSASKACASWHGVGCDPTTGRVTGVTLTGGVGFVLSGNLPPELGSLAALRTLVLNAHTLRGPVPRQLSAIPRLSKLDLSRNDFGCSVALGQVGNMTALEHLDLSSSGLAGSLPTALARLALLTHLDLSANALQGAIPPQLGNMKGLQTLLLGSNRISGCLPGSLTRMKKLTLLDASNNLVSGSLPEAFGALQNLQALNVAGNSLTGSLAPGLAGMGSSASMMELRISDNRISGSIPTALYRLNLIADRNRLTGPLPGTFPASPYGSFAGNFLTGTCPYFNTTAGMCSPRGSECPHVLLDLRNRLEGNCLKHCVLGKGVGASQKPAAACARACGSDAHGGACYNEGSCEFSGPNQAPTCTCTSASLFNPYYNPGTCVPARDANDPPPLPTRKFPIGIVFPTKPAPPDTHLNKWSRYLSVGSQLQNLGQGQSRVTWGLPGEFSWGGEWTEGPLTWSVTRDQGVCACSWATATVDSIAAATKIASSKTGGKVPVLSVSQVLRCSGGGKSGQCKGDVVTTALAYSVKAGVLTDASFRGNKTCESVSKVPPLVIMYEAVAYRGYLGLLLTVQSQPALVIIQAARVFQQAACYDSTLVFQDPSCYTGSLDHTVLVVGYSIARGTPFFVLRNSWGSAWCQMGTIRVAIQGGAGVCGMNVLPAYYPIPAPAKGDPCYRNSLVAHGGGGGKGGGGPALNPCGGGQCVPNPSGGSYSYTCKCPSGFVAVNNSVRVRLAGAGEGVTQACVPVDACSATVEGPCGVGSCVNDRKGSYSCLCPPGTHEGKLANGQPTCSFGQAPKKTLTVKPGVTCCLIAATFQIPLQQLKKRNPKVNCNNLKPGTVLNVSSPSYACSSTYTVTSRFPTFENISKFVLWPKEPSSVYDTYSYPPPVDLKSLNPTAHCGKLVPGQAICLRRGQWPRQECSLRYTMQAGDTCQSVTGRFFRDPRSGPYVKERDPMPFFGMNPGLRCDLLEAAGESGNRTSFIGAQGISVCISMTPQPTFGPSSPCPKPLGAFYLEQGDSCVAMAAAAQKSTFHFQSAHFTVVSSVMSVVLCSLLLL